jgi:hypothetical protein
MTRVVSFAEPTVGAVTLAATVPDGDLATVLADLAEDRVAAQKKIDRWLWAQVPDLFAHEWSHIFQVCSYPLLYLRAARQGRLMAQRAKAIADLPDGTELPIRGALKEQAGMSDLIEVVSVRFLFEPDGIRLAPLPSRRPRRGVLQELDLVEEDATVFQFRVEVGSRGSGHGYRRWLAERARYSALFSFLSTFATDDQALALLPVFARVALRTLRPLESLAAMLTDVVRDGADVYTTDLPDDDWDTWAEEFFTSRLLERVSPAPAVDRLFFGQTMGDEQGHVDDGAFGELVDGTPHLPLGTLARWSREDAGLLDRVLRAPWTFIDRDGNRDARLERFLPPLSVYVLTGEPSGQRVVLLLPSDAMRRTPAPPALQVAGVPQVTMKTLVHEAWRGKSMLDASLGRRTPVVPCHHTGCRFHSKGLCEAWLPIPSEPEDCEFPPWLSSTTGKDVSPDGTRLIAGPSIPGPA